MELKSADEKGIVICRPPYFDEQGIEHAQYFLSGFELRKYLLYWDKISSPDYMLLPEEKAPRADGLVFQLDFSNPEDVAKIRTYSKSDDMFYLEQTGHLLEKMTFIDGKKFERDQFYFEAHRRAFHYLNAESPGQWDREAAGVFDESPETLDGGTLQFAINNLLPVPAEDTPLDDILNFKLKNRDNLLAFRFYLDDIYQSVLASADPQRAAVTALSRLEKETNGILTGLQSLGIRTFMTSQVSYLSAEFFGLASYAELVSKLPKKLDIELSPLTAVAGGVGLAVGINKLIKSSIKETTEPMRYIESVGANFGKLVTAEKTV